MPARQYRSTVQAKTLSVGINNSIESMTLGPDTLTLPSTYPYTMVIDPDLASEEIVTVLSSPSAGTFTISRGQDGTSKQAHTASAVVKHMGSVVGTLKTQTLTNKTLTSPTINGATLTGTVVLPSTTSIGTITSTELGYVDGVTSAIQTQLNTNTPVGSIVMWAKSDIPTGWLECNGQSTSSYPTLAGVVGANVPDMQGLVPVGFKTSDDAFGTLKGTGGSKTSTAAHTHGLASHTHTIDHDHGAFNTTGGEGAGGV